MSNEVSEITQSLRIFVLYVNSLQGDSPGVSETISGGPQIQNYFHNNIKTLFAVFAYNVS